jgi:hypothetical protein
VRAFKKVPTFSGRPLKSTDREDRKIRRLSVANPFMPATQIKAELPEINISVITIRRRLRKKFGLPARRPAKKPYISAKNRQKRLEWAKAHVNWTVRLLVYRG